MSAKAVRKPRTRGPKTRRAASKTTKVRKAVALDWSAFPAASVTQYARSLCLACTFDIFTKQLALSPRAAYLAVKKHAPEIEELTGARISRPFFVSGDKHPHCPYCDSSGRWHARIETGRIEGSRITDKPRRDLIESLPKSEDQFLILEKKASRRDMLFAWLGSLSRRWAFDRDEWLMESARAYLERVEPKTDWREQFSQIHTVRRSARLEEGWEIDAGRLFLAPAIFNELLLVQYLVSRSHKAGGRTLEGRLTLRELMSRLRRRGYLREQGIGDADPFDALEKLVESLGESDGSVKLYYIVDRRELLDKLKIVYAKYSN